MALHNLKITVIDGGGKGGGLGGGDNEGGNKKKPSVKDSKLYKFFHFNQAIKSKLEKATSPATMFAVQMGINAASQTARQFINYYVSDIGRRNGDSNYQAIVNRRIEQVTDGLSLAGGALSGATAGSMFGIGGVIVGAAIGAISSGANLGFKYAARERDYQHEMFKDSNSQAYSLARAGNMALTGRLR